jgi:hypothetical protein
VNLAQLQSATEVQNLRSGVRYPDLSLVEAVEQSIQNQEQLEREAKSVEAKDLERREEVFCFTVHAIWYDRTSYPKDFLPYSARSTVSFSNNCVDAALAAQFPLTRFCNNPNTLKDYSTETLSLMTRLL